MKLNLITVSPATLVAAGAFPAHAPVLRRMSCGYHHTLGDDAIMMFAANQALRTFWQHPHRRGLYLTRLRAQPDTTCDQ